MLNRKTKKKRLIIIGGGYTLKEGVNKGLWKHIKGQEIWSINNAFKRMPYFPSKQLWLDSSFFLNNIDKLKLLSNNGVDLVCGEERYEIFYNLLKCVCRLLKKNNNKQTELVIRKVFFKFLKPACGNKAFLSYVMINFFYFSPYEPYRFLFDAKNNQYLLVKGLNKPGKPQKVYFLNPDKKDDLFILLKRKIQDLFKKIKKYNFIKNIKLNQVTSDMDLYLKEEALFSSGLTGKFALSLALKNNYNEIFLLGYDFGVSSNVSDIKKYYKSKIKAFQLEGENFNNLKRYYNSNEKIKEKEIKEFGIFLKQSKIKNINIYNVSKISNIPYFKKLEYNEFFDLLNK